MTLQINHVPLRELKLASEAPPEMDLVVRKARDIPQAYENLKASIRRVGLLTPLIVHNNGEGMFVTAGNRRLAALRDLYADLPDYMVPVVDDISLPAGSREIAVMQNIALPMHPIDQFEVIVAAEQSGMAVADIAEAWGLTERRVQQVLAYGNLHPLVREAWRENTIDSEVAKAFTLGDVDEQEKLFKRLIKNGAFFADTVADHLIGKHRDTGPMLEIVGIDVYEAAGGEVRRDLFGTRHSVSDAKLLKKLAEAKVDEEVMRLVAEGWKWAERKPQEEWKWPHVPPKKETWSAEQRSAHEQAKEWLEQHAIENAVKLASYTAAERAELGCFVEIGITSGRLLIQPGRVRPEEARKAAAKGKKAAAAEKPSAPGKENSQLSISNKLMERLSVTLTEACAFTIAENPKVALAALVAGFASRGEVAKVRCDGLGNKEASSMSTAFEVTFHAASKLSIDALAKKLAAICADALDFQSFRAEQPPLEDKGVAALCNAMDITFQLFNHFDPLDYFMSVSRELCMAAIAEMTGGDVPGKPAKAELAEAAAELAVKHKWLPPQLRTSHYAAKAALKKKGARK
jgi:ParB family chromosome partitioning protein